MGALNQAVAFAEKLYYAKFFIGISALANCTFSLYAVWSWTANNWLAAALIALLFFLFNVLVVAYAITDWTRSVKKMRITLSDDEQPRRP